MHSVFTSKNKSWPFDLAHYTLTRLFNNENFFDIRYLCLFVIHHLRSVRFDSTDGQSHLCVIGILQRTLAVASNLFEAITSRLQ